MTIELAIVGAGRIAADHVRAVNARDDVRVTMIVDPDITNARHLSAQLEGAEVADSIDAIPASVHGAIVCSPTAMHASQATALVERGIGVLIEKPLAADLDEAKRLVSLAEQRDVVAMSAQVLRYTPLADAVREVIDSGRFGTPVQVIERRLADRSDNYPWWRDLPAFLVSHWGSHSLDLTCHLFNDTVERVTCEADSIRSEFGVIDDFSLLARFRSGLRFTSTMSFSSREVLHDIVLIGTGATIVLECYRAVSVDGIEVLRMTEADILEAAFTKQLEDFVARLSGSTMGLADARTALPALAALAAAERAALARDGLHSMLVGL